MRAVGVVFSESGSPKQKEEAKQWLVGLLKDPSEKIRRYAMTALPKLGAEPHQEAALLSLLRSSTNEREKKFLGRTLDKIGGLATLELISTKTQNFTPQTEQKVKARVAREESPSAIRMDGIFSDFGRLRIHLRGRKGLEQIVREEVEEFIRSHGKFRVGFVGAGLVEVVTEAPFSLSDIYKLRCFGAMGFVLGTVNPATEAESIEAFASVIASPLTLRLLKTFTTGSLRYRLDFAIKGHQRGAVRSVANRAYAICPEILNDAQNAPWSVDIHPSKRGDSVELRPRLSPDPRFYFRESDVRAASHPPLAAAMARLAGRFEGDVVWDPFCGSGLELIERMLLGGVQRIYGTDISSAAIAIAQSNLSCANVALPPAQFTCADFHDFATIPGLGPESVTLIITNPPMGRRVPVRNLHLLIEDLFSVAAKALRAGGRLVLANPLKLKTPPPSLELNSSRIVDLGGFDCRLELWVKTGSWNPVMAAASPPLV